MQWITVAAPDPHAARRSRTQSGSTQTHGAMADRLGNIACFLLVAAAFAAITHQALVQEVPTHSGNQEYVRR
jgi:hypothetical protein